MLIGLKKNYFLFHKYKKLKTENATSIYILVFWLFPCMQIRNLCLDIFPGIYFADMLLSPRVGNGSKVRHLINLLTWAHSHANCAAVAL